MKIRLLALLLVVVLLFTACTPSNLGGTETTAPSTTSPTQTTTTHPTEPPIPTVDEVINCTYETEGGMEGFSNFYYIFAQDWDDKESGSITVTRTESDGTQTVIELSGKAGSDFKYKVGDTTLSFRYLVYCQYTGTKENDFEYLEYFLMANDPNATYLDTLEINGASAVLVYAEYLDRTVSRAESYGNVPEGVQALAEMRRTPINVPCLKDSIFFEDDDGTLKRYNYNGNLISCLDALPEEKTYQYVREMPDGGFVIVINTRTPDEDYPNSSYNTIVCYDKDGNQRWEYAPADKYDLSSVSNLFVHNNTIYVYIYGTFIRLSLDGKLIDQKTYDTTASFSRIVPIEDGFEVYLRTPEKSDDFPISENGEKYIKAILDFECNIVSISYMEDFVDIGESGILGDKYYFIDDPIFDISDKDRLPTGHRIGSNKIFSIDGGYVIVRKHLLDECHMWRASGIVDNYYYEAILTGYDHDGNPLWQTTSLIMAPLFPSYTKTNGK